MQITNSAGFWRTLLGLSVGFAIVVSGMLGLSTAVANRYELINPYDIEVEHILGSMEAME